MRSRWQMFAAKWARATAHFATWLSRKRKPTKETTSYKIIQVGWATAVARCAPDRIKSDQIITCEKKKKKKQSSEMWLLVSRRLFVAPLVCLPVLVLLLYLWGWTSAASSEHHHQQQQVVAIEQVASQRPWLLLSAATNQAAAANQVEQWSSSSSELDQEEEQEHPKSFIGNSSATGSAEAAARRRREPKRIRRLAHLDRRPILNEFSFPANLVQGMRFVLMCQVLDGDLPIQIKWFKDQQELLEDSNGQQQQQQPQLRSVAAAELEIELLSNDELGSSLLFRKVQQKHSGNYTCLAKNQLGSTSFSSSLSVKIPPKWRIEPQDQAESIIGEQATIHCQAEGNPNPFIRWKFSPIQQHQQATAAAANSLTTSAPGHQQHNGHLMAPPTAEYTLALQANSFKLINSNHHVQTLENGSLTIRHVSKDDEGFYLCEADNGLEPSLSKVLRLIVHQQAQIIDDLRLLGSQAAAAAAPQEPLMNPPASPVIRSVRLQSAPVNATSQQQQQPLRILCQPAGDLPLTVDWLKDEQLIYTHTILSSEPSATISSASSPPLIAAAAADSQQLGRLHVNTRRSGTRPHQQQQQQASFESELYLTGLRRSDAGIFACSARNAFGHSERQMKLLLQEPPEPPEVVDVGHIGSRSIGLRWLPSQFDGNSPILKYIVEYRRLAGSLADPPQAIEWPDEQQQPATQVPMDKTEAGQSERIIQQQQQQQPTKQASASAGEQQQQPVLHTVHDLEPLARYSMRVIAVNAVGRSRPSIALTLRTEEEVPSVIPALVGAIVLGSRSVKLHWTLNHSPEREIIDGFFIGYRSFDTQALLAHDQQLKPANPVAIKPDEGQPTFTYKTVRLNKQQHATGAGAGTGGAGAGAGAGEQQEMLDPNSVYISPLSSMTKSVVPVANNNLQQQVVSSSFEYIIGGLERNTEYSILIQCFNKKGAGPTSDPVIFKTFANDPPEKLALSADEISESGVRVNWRFIMANSQWQQSGEKYQLVDGFVLAFAKLINNNNNLRLSAANEVAANNRQQLVVGSSVAAARIATSPQLVGANLSSSQAVIDQWQAIQLAPQQRSHQLKNLECGTSYAMKIWAFNKIGKGEPSDLLTVSTRGKAPIAPDRRSFLSINSTQVRLHLSAWYDGGCEIEKFVVQYKVRGQQEWTLVSNNILREQLSVVIRDLSPATSYELLVGAQNQVALTEVKYRFVTLDGEGKQVPSVEANSFASSSVDDSELVIDYSDSEGTRREPRPNEASSIARSMLIVRHFMNSPLALVLSLCFFVALLMVLIFYKFNAQGGQSSPSVSTLNLNAANKCSGARSGSGSGGGEPNMALMNDCELINGAHSVANTSGSGCTADSPARMSTFQQQQQQQPQHSIRLLNHYSDSCHYQPFCDPMSAHQQHQSADGTEYSHYGLPSSAYETTTTTATTAGNLLYSATPQRGATTMDQASQQSSAAMMMAADQDRSRQLIQMLMLQGQNQSHLEEIPENSLQQQQESASFAAAALATMARGGVNRHSLAGKLNNYPFQANTLGRQSSSNNNNNSFLEQTRRRPEAQATNATVQYPMSTFRVKTATGQEETTTTTTTMANLSALDSSYNSASCSTATSSTSGHGTVQEKSIHEPSIKLEQINCDREHLSTYDVPFKFNGGQNSGGGGATAADNHDKKHDRLDLNTICY